MIKIKQLIINIFTGNAKRRVRIGALHMELPPISMQSNNKVQLSATLLKPDGSEDTTTQLSWSSSDPSVGLEVSDDTKSAWVTTPAESGDAIITVSAHNYESDTIHVTYTPFVPGKINLTVGTPVED